MVGGHKLVGDVSDAEAQTIFKSAIVENHNMVQTVFIASHASKKQTLVHLAKAYLTPHDNARWANLAFVPSPKSILLLLVRN